MGCDQDGFSPPEIRCDMALPVREHAVERVVQGLGRREGLRVHVGIAGVKPRVPGVIP